jgi:hypothetical protein
MPKPKRFKYIAVLATARLLRGLVAAQLHSHPGSTRGIVSSKPVVNVDE